MTFWKRLFDSSIQKQRRPIQDPTKFHEIVGQFQQEQSRLLHAAISGAAPLDFEESGKVATNMLSLAGELIEMEPRRGVPWMCRCHALGALFRFSEALVALDHAIEIDPSDPEKWELRVTILRQLNRADEADAAAKQYQLLMRR